MTNTRDRHDVQFFDSRKAADVLEALKPPTRAERLAGAKQAVDHALKRLRESNRLSGGPLGECLGDARLALMSATDELEALLSAERARLAEVVAPTQAEERCK